MLFPARVARIDGAVGRDGEVVRLIEVVGVEIGFDVLAIRSDQKNVVLLVVGDEHPSVPIEADGIADAAFRQHRE